MPCFACSMEQTQIAAAVQNLECLYFDNICEMPNTGLTARLFVVKIKKGDDA